MQTIYCFERFELDPERRELRCDGRGLTLEPVVFDVLHSLVRRDGRIATKADLLDEVWKGQEVGESSLSRAISLLRAALGDSPTRPRFIATVYGRGYRFLEEVHRRSPEGATAGWIKVCPPECTAGEDSATALLEQARALARAGRGEECRRTAIAAAREARRNRDARQLARAALVHAESTSFFVKNDLIDSSLLREALDVLPAGETVLRAQVQARLACAESTRLAPDERSALVDAALRTARRSGDERVLSIVLNAGARALDSPELGGRSRALAAEAISRARRLGDPLLQVEAQRSGLLHAFQRGDLSAIDAGVAEIDRLARGLDHSGWSAVRASVRIARATLAGRFDEVDRVARDAFPGHEPGSDEHTILVESLWFIARERESAAELARFVEPFTATYPLARAALCTLLAEMDMRDTADHLLGELVGPGGVAVPHDFAWLVSVCFLGSACCELEDRERARAVHAALLPFADRFATFACFSVLGPVSQFACELEMLLGDHDAAAAHVAHAAQTSRRLRSPPLEAYAELTRAKLLDALGQCRAARELAGHVRDRAAAMDMRRLEKLARALADRA
jgi:DNA-binding winged helix-turn-helix (wHTH) protein